MDQKRSEILLLLGAAGFLSLASPASRPAIIILVDAPHGHGRLPPAPSPRILLRSRGRRPPPRVPVAAQAAALRRRHARRRSLQT